jgi:hypothetical protein
MGLKAQFQIKFYLAKHCSQPDYIQDLVTRLLQATYSATRNEVRSMFWVPFLLQL